MEKTINKNTKLSISIKAEALLGKAIKALVLGKESVYLNAYYNPTHEENKKAPHYGSQEVGVWIEEKEATQK